MAWPLSALGAPIGNTLLLPSIVQAKFWSDFVAAIIEGSGKYKNIIKLKERIIKSLLPNLKNEDKESEILAVLDIIYLMSESTRVKPVIKKQLIQKVKFKDRIRNIFKREKIKPQASEHYYNLSKWLSSRGNFDNLCNYIIEYYNKEQSFYLLQIVSSHYTKTSNWIEKLKS